MKARGSALLLWSRSVPASFPSAPFPAVTSLCPRKASGFCCAPGCPPVPQTQLDAPLPGWECGLPDLCLCSRARVEWRRSFSLTLGDGLIMQFKAPSISSPWSRHEHFANVLKCQWQQYNTATVLFSCLLYLSCLPLPSASTPPWTPAFYPI